jgi:hypothetical protein
MEHLWRVGAAMGTAWLSHWGFSLGWRIGELEAALRIVVKEESIWAGGNDRGAKYPLQDSYGKQSLILKDWGRLEEAMALLKKQEALCLELGHKDGLQIAYGNQAVILKA